MIEWENELSKVTHRDYHEGNLLSEASADSIYTEREHSEKEYNVAGIIVEVQPDYLLVDVRSAFFPGDDLELVCFEQNTKQFKADFITNVLGEDCLKTNPGTLVKIPMVKEAKIYNLSTPEKYGKSTFSILKANISYKKSDLLKLERNNIINESWGCNFLPN